MVHSIRVVGQHAVAWHPEAGNWSPEQEGSLRSLVQAWWQAASRVYLSEYVRAAEADGFLPDTVEDRARIIDALLFERAVYDLGYALVHRGSRVALPLRRVMELLERS
jgi:predicted trehalose synthase